MLRYIFLYTVLLFSVTSKAQTVITVTSTGTNSTIDSAINYTTAIWEQYLVSDVPIKINIINTDMGTTGTLGFILSNMRKDFTGAPVADTWYVTSLANSISGTELNAGEFDMDIYMNSIANYYYGIDGNPGVNEYDFVTILFHEICHGLGVVSLAKTDSVNGSFGEIIADDFLPLAPSFPFPDLLGKPAIWNRFLENGSGDLLTDSIAFPNNSVLLKNELESDDVFFNGSAATSANSTSLPKIYAPSSFIFGASISHFDPSAFPPSGENSLMTPSLAPQYVEHAPGIVLLGALQDIGWTVNSTVSVTENQDELHNIMVYPNPFNSQTTVNFSLGSKQDVVIEVYNLLGEKVITLLDQKLPSGVHNVSWNGTGKMQDHCPAGTYLYKLSTNRNIFVGKFQYMGR
ncbi:MAG: T9SS type A sorting domain-containing protein [Bacteroidota bacterium]